MLYATVPAVYHQTQGGEHFGLGRKDSWHRRQGVDSVGFKVTTLQSRPLGTTSPRAITGVVKMPPMPHEGLLPLQLLPLGRLM